LQDKANPDIIYLGTNIGIGQSADRGVSWTLAPPETASGKENSGKSSGATARTMKKTAPRRPRRWQAARESLRASGAYPGPAIIPALTTKVNVLTLTDDGKSGILAAPTTAFFYDITKGWENAARDRTAAAFRSFTTAAHPGTIWVGTNKRASCRR
jgi:hypothetical protein